MECSRCNTPQTLLSSHKLLHQVTRRHDMQQLCQYFRGMLVYIKAKLKHKCAFAVLVQLYLDDCGIDSIGES